MYVVVLGMRAQLRPAVVVFDLDGTLIVFKLNVRAAKQRIIQRLKELGLNTQGITADDSVQSIITKTLGNNSGVEREFVRREVLDVMKKFEINASAVAEPREGAAYVLQELKKRGYRVAVATNTHRDAALRALERSGLLSDIDFLATRDDVENLKPRGDILRHLLERLNVKPHDALYIGDSIHDMQAAAEAGVPFIGIEGGIHPGKELQRGSILPVLKELHGLLDYLA